MTGIRRGLVIATLWGAAIAAGPVLGRLAPDVMTASRGFTLSSAFCFAAMALSLDLVVGHAGLFTLGHGAVLSIGAVVSGVITGRWGAPFLVGVLASSALCAALSWVLARPALRLKAMSLGAVTLGLAIVVEASLFRWGWLTGGDEGLVLPRPLVGAFRFSASTDFAGIAGVVAAGLWWLDRWIGRHGFGRALHAVREDERFAVALGVDVEAAKLRAFTLAGAAAGVAGATYGHLLITVGPATFGYATLSLPLLALVVIGGQGSAGAVAAVAAGFAVMPSALAAFDEWSGVIGALLFLNAVARHPEGVAGAVRAIRRKRRRPAEVRVPRVAGLVAPVRVPPPSTLSLRDVSVEVGSRAILQGVSLDVPPGSIVALIGPNGAGKTTTLDAISGFRPLSGGAILWRDRELSALPANARRGQGIARTFQGIGLARRLDVQETLLLAAAGGAEADRRARVRDVARSIGFDDRLDVPVRELSVGQQRLLEITAALVSDAPLLLLDEPAAGLAPPVVTEVAAALVHARGHLGRTIVLVEHNVALVRAVADLVFVLDEGIVTASGPAEDVLATTTGTFGTWLGVRA